MVTGGRRSMGTIAGGQVPAASADGGSSSSIDIKNVNFRQLFSGCLDKDRTVFCASRLTQFSCVFWRHVPNITQILDTANQNKKAKQVEINLRRQLGADFNDKFFVELENKEGTVQLPGNSSNALDFLFSHSPPGLTPIGGDGKVPSRNNTGSPYSFTKQSSNHPGHPAPSGFSPQGGRPAVPMGIPTDWTNGQQSFSPFHAGVTELTKRTFQSECGLLRGRDHFIDHRFVWLHLVCLPLLLLFTLGTCVRLSSIMLRLSRHHFPLCIYAVLLGWLEFVLFVIQASDLWIQTLTQSSLTVSILLLNDSYCQVYHFVYTFLCHLRNLLYPVIATDTWRLLRNPKHYYLAYSASWIRSTIILIFVVLATCNCQFLWTFAVVHQDNTLLHPNRGLLCTFSVKSVHNTYRDFVWPIIDGLLGDFIPFIMTTVFTIWGFRLYIRRGIRQQRQTIEQQESDNDLHKYILDVKIFFQMCRAFLTFCLVYLISALPHLVFFGVKYLNYLQDKIQDAIDYKEGRLLLVITKARELRRQERRSNRRIIEPQLETLETVVIYANFLFVAFKFVIFVGLVDNVRENFLPASPFARLLRVLPSHRWKRQHRVIGGESSLVLQPHNHLSNNNNKQRPSEHKENKDDAKEGQYSARHSISGRGSICFVPVPIQNSSSPSPSNSSRKHYLI